MAIFYVHKMVKTQHKNKTPNYIINIILIFSKKKMNFIIIFKFFFFDVGTIYGFKVGDIILKINYIH
jgi:hypothetical protein